MEGRMMRTAMFLAAALGLFLIEPAQAQVRFGWQAGTTLHYRFEHTTQVSEQVGDNSVTSSTKLQGAKRWQVQEVTPQGIATLQMSMTALRYEIKTSSGDTLIYDSTEPEKSSPDLREQLGKYVNTPLVVLKLDAQGKVVEVQKCSFGSANGFEAQPPFLITLPENGLEANQTWQRQYMLTLDPPHGTGEKYGAVQNYLCKTIEGGRATVGLTTTVAKPPESAADRVPLLQWLPEGEVVFDLKTGWTVSGRLRVSQELKGHQGEGSVYKFQSSYEETLVSQ
jgi:hypothetical protein